MTLLVVPVSRVVTLHKMWPLILILYLLPSFSNAAPHEQGRCSSLPSPLLDCASCLRTDGGGSSSSPSRCMWDPTEDLCLFRNTSDYQPGGSYIFNQSQCPYFCSSFVEYCGPTSTVIAVFAAIFGIFSILVLIAFNRLGTVSVSSSTQEDLSLVIVKEKHSSKKIFTILAITFAASGLYSLSFLPFPGMALMVSILSLGGSFYLLYFLKNHFKGLGNALMELLQWNKYMHAVNLETELNGLNYLPFQRAASVIEKEQIFFIYESRFDQKKYMVVCYFYLCFPLIFIAFGMGITLSTYTVVTGLFLIISTTMTICLVLAALFYSHHGIILTERNIYMLSHTVFNPFQVAEVTPYSSVTIKLTKNHIFPSTTSVALLYGTHSHTRTAGISIPDENIPKFKEVLQQLQLKPQPPNQLCAGMRCFNFPHRMLVLILLAGYAVSLLIYIIGWAADWGIFFKLEFCLFPALWMGLWVVFSVFQATNEVYSNEQ